MSVKHGTLVLFSSLFLLLSAGGAVADDPNGEEVDVSTAPELSETTVTKTNRRAPHCSVSGKTYFAVYLGLLVCEGWVWSDEELKNRAPVFRRTFMAGHADVPPTPFTVQLGK